MGTYVLSTPISKEKIIISRYITSFSIILTISLVSTLFNIFYFFYASPYTLEIHMLTIFLSLFLCVLYLSLLIPFVYQNGANDGSTVMLILILLFSGITYLINAQLIPVNVIMGINPVLLIVILLFIMVIVTLISIYFSIRIVNKKLQ